MRRFSNFQALALSFYSRDLYRDVASHWKGAGLLYQLLLMVFATIVVAIRMHLGVAQWAAQDVPPVIAQVPTIRIVNGEASVNRQTPVTITDPRTGKALAIIDTSGEVTSLEGTDARILLTRKQVIVLRRQGFTQAYDLRSINNLTLDRPTLSRWARLIATWSALLMSPFVLAGFYVTRLLVMLLCSTILFLIARSSKSPLDFAASTRLASVALTPATLLETALDAIMKKPAFLGVVWTLVTVGYLVFAFRSRTGSAAAPIADTVEEAAPEPDIRHDFR